MERRNNKGFTLIELLAVIVVLAVIALIATPIILGIINDARESSNARSVESYAKEIETTVTTYLTLNPDVKDVKICVGEGPAGTDCQVDATVAGRDAGTPGGNAEKVVTYSGSGVYCTSATFDSATGKVDVKECHVGNNDVNYDYNTGSGEGAKKSA